MGSKWRQKKLHSPNLNALTRRIARLYRVASVRTTRLPFAPLYSNLELPGRATPTESENSDNMRNVLALRSAQSAIKNTDYSKYTRLAGQGAQVAVARRGRDPVHLVRPRRGVRRGGRRDRDLLLEIGRDVHRRAGGLGRARNGGSGQG